MKGCSRRSFLAGAGIAAAACAARPLIGMAEASKSPFKIAVINDEISQDFDHDCYVAYHDFGMNWIELRSMWGKNVTELSESQIDDAQKILKKYNLRVTDIAKILHIPLVWLVNCSGVKLPEQEKVYANRRGQGTCFFRHAELEQMGIPGGLF